MIYVTNIHHGRLPENLHGRGRWAPDRLRVEPHAGRAGRLGLRKMDDFTEDLEIRSHGGLQNGWFIGENPNLKLG